MDLRKKVDAGVQKNKFMNEWINTYNQTTKTPRSCPCGGKQDKLMCSAIETYARTAMDYNGLQKFVYAMRQHSMIKMDDMDNSTTSLDNFCIGLMDNIAPENVWTFSLKTAGEFINFKPDRHTNHCGSITAISAVEVHRS